MKNLIFAVLLLGSRLLAPGSPTNHLSAARDAGPAKARVQQLPAEVKRRVLALDPEHVSEREIKDWLGQLPAPEVFCIHGGILPVKTPAMNSFAEFLIGMGYPESSLRRPDTGELSFDFYADHQKIAGTVLWYFQRDGLRPMIVGHSQGGFQALRVLHLLATNTPASAELWNPLTTNWEHTASLVATGRMVSFATVVASGGLARALPGEWDMNKKLRIVPDSVEEFMGFQKGMDLLGGDNLGYGSGNDYHAAGIAKVRNVRLPTMGVHWRIPYAEGFLKKPETLKWIDAYQPDDHSQSASAAGQPPDGMSARVLWAAEVWHGVKKHWVLELQRLIREQNVGNS